MILSLFLGALVSLILFLPTFFTIRNRGLNYKYLKKMKCKVFLFKKKKKLFLLDENSLQSQPLFWTVIALPLAMGVMLWAAIAYDYDLELTSDAYSRLMKNAQFPFVILALSPIMGAFVMYGHRSLQTFTQINATNKQIETATKQLKEAERKNGIDIYFANRKFINEQLSDIEMFDSGKIYSPNLLYMKFFYPLNEKRDVLNGNTIRILNNHFNNLNNCYEAYLDIETLRDPYSNISSPMGDSYIRKVDLASKIMNDIMIMFNFKKPNFDEAKFALNVYFGSLYSEMKRNDGEIRLLSFYSSVLVECRYFLDLVENILRILFSFEKTGAAYSEIPHFKECRTTVNKMLLKYDEMNIGDKLAAENQNPPE